MKTIPVKIDYNAGLLVFRALAAMALMRAHGIPKLINFQDTLNHIPDPLGFGATFSASFAVFANVFCAFLVVIGFMTRFATLLILLLTLTGLLIVHSNDPVKIQDTPIIYSIVFGFITFVGAGRYSLDFRLFNKN